MIGCARLRIKLPLLLLHRIAVFQEIPFVSKPCSKLKNYTVKTQKKSKSISDGEKFFQRYGTTGISKGAVINYDREGGGSLAAGV